MPSQQRRRIRNYILDAPLQLRLTGYTVLVALTVAAIAGVFIWGTTQTLFRQASELVDARTTAAEAGKNVAITVLNKRVTDSEMELVHLDVTDRLREDIQAHFDQERAKILAERAALLQAHRDALIKLGVGIFLFVLAAALVSIVLTHRIAGPVYRMRRMIEEVASGRLADANRPLRRGDLLVGLFSDLCRMVEALRAKERAELDELSAALSEAQSQGSATALRQLERLQREKREKLGLPRLAAAAEPAAGEDSSATGG